MVPVTTKPATHRVAIAAGRVRFANPTVARLVADAAVAKGDVLAVARVAGIMAAKRCADLVPLCHPIAVSHVGVEVAVVVPGGERGAASGDEGLRAGEEEGEDGMWRCGGVRIEARVECQGPTGVEMEAMTAVMGAALTVYDMCKAVDRGMVVEDVRVVLKEGGRSGRWAEEGYVSLGEG